MYNFNSPNQPRFDIYYLDGENREVWYTMNVGRTYNSSEMKSMVERIFREGFSYELTEPDYQVKKGIRHISPNRITYIDYVEPNSNT